MTSEAMRTLTVSLPPRQMAKLEKAVESGAYASSGEIVRDALQLWEREQELRAVELSTLKKAYDEGVASGPGRDVDAATLLANIKAKAAARG